MKLGSRIIEPLTGYSARCIGFRAGIPVGKRPDGSLFFGRSPRGSKRKQYRVRVVDGVDVLSPWLAAENRKGCMLITAEHPLWRGAKVQRDDLEIEEVA